MLTPTISYPVAAPGDSQPVISALSAGSLEWTRGEFKEAVRWVQRAMDAAEAAGDYRRALSLARAAAELTNSLDLEPTVPSTRDEAATLAPFDDFNDQTIVDSPANVAARPVQHSGVIIEERAPSAPIRVRQTDPLISDSLTGETPTARMALRVAITRTGTDRVLTVRVLDENVPAPAGTREGLLVLLDPEPVFPVTPS